MEGEPPSEVFLELVGEPTGGEELDEALSEAGAGGGREGDDDGEEDEGKVDRVDAMAEEAEGFGGG